MTTEGYEECYTCKKTVRGEMPECKPRSSKQKMAGAMVLVEIEPTEKLEEKEREGAHCAEIAGVKDCIKCHTKMYDIAVGTKECKPREWREDYAGGDLFHIVADKSQLKKLEREWTNCFELEDYRDCIQCSTFSSGD
jgi:hypothetical protein